MSVSDLEVGRRLQRIREFAGLTQQQVADALDMSDHGYRNYEAGRTQPPYRVIHLLAELFEMPRLTLTRALGLVEEGEAETLDQWVSKRGLFASMRDNAILTAESQSRHKRARPGGQRTVRGEVVSGEHDQGSDATGPYDVRKERLFGHRLALAGYAVPQ